MHKDLEIKTGASSSVPSPFAPTMQLAAKRRRIGDMADGPPAPEPTDIPPVVSLLQIFDREWDMNKWEQVLNAVDVPGDAFDVLQEAIAGHGARDRKHLKVLQKIPLFTAVKALIRIE